MHCAWYEYMHVTFFSLIFYKKKKVWNYSSFLRDALAHENDRDRPKEKKEKKGKEKPSQP